MSIQVAKLENELEVIIFDRSKKPLKPTAIGEKIIEQAKVVLNESKRIEQTLQQAIVSYDGFTCAVSRKDLAPVFKQINFQNRHQQIFDMDNEMFAPGSVLLLVELSKSSDLTETIGIYAFSAACLARLCLFDDFTRFFFFFYSFFFRSCNG